jgi:signal transduction histidine kinase
MRLNLDLLAEEFEQPADARQSRILQRIDRVRKESHRLEALLEDFLRYARVIDVHSQPVDLNEVVDDFRDFYEPQAADQGIIIRTHLADDLPRVALDVDRFRDVLFNLVRNAQLAMPDGGELLFQSRADEGGVVLEVTDTGCGIAADALPCIFDVFFSTRRGGTGLGLPTARKIIEAHGGTIDAESEPGKGSKFTIRLPRFGGYNGS